MARKGVVRRWVVAGAVMCAMLAGFVFGRTSHAPFTFLEGAELVAIQKDKNGARRSDTRTTTYYYTLPGSPADVYKHARAELPVALESRRGLDSPEVLQLVVPRTEEGRISLLFPPDKILYVSPGKLSVDASGRPVRSRAAEAEWTTVEVLDFRSPSTFEQIAQWLRRTIQI
jgi:hypothetical protein